MPNVDLNRTVAVAAINSEGQPLSIDNDAKFDDDFIAKGEDFNRTLNLAERQAFVNAFPNANFETIKFLGISSVRPSPENCISYECMPVAAHIYDIKEEYVGSFSARKGQIAMMQRIWDICNSAEYKCAYTGHPVGATYNCIGHALGISKWFDPKEITSHIQDGMTRHEAIATLIEDKRKIYSGLHESNFDHVVEELHPTKDSAENSIKENTVAFFFNETSGVCLHGARYINKFHDQDIGGKWTSKLGSSITISHELPDLLGGAYGDGLYYAETI
jgi:hypothetical protein